jgi:6-phospho-beta-glucosidase
MKIALIGGGGVRTPLVVAATVRRADRIGLDELCLMDIDAEKLALIGALCRVVVRTLDSPLRLTITTDPREAVAGAQHVITSIRVGTEQGRVLDERIALRHGVLGQETTGPGGFAMALRSIPALLEYAKLIEEVSPGAWMFNFTNPAGLVTQALRDSGFSRTVGICDGANLGQHAVADWLKEDAHRLRPEVFGLNHLSWTRRVWRNGQEMLGALLRDPAFLSGTTMAMFALPLVEYVGMWINEYLFYYYYPDRAVKSISADEKTRGEEVLDLNRRLVDQLRAADIEGHPDEALRLYHAYEQRRSATYMHYARADAPTMQEADHAEVVGTFTSEAGEGYAGVALSLIEAMQTDGPLYTAVNVPNEGAIDCMRPEDVVEVSCAVDRDGVHPLKIGAIPEPQELLMRSVKQYERLTVEAALTRSRRTAVLALMAHPLVLSYSLAETLVDEYLDAHRAYVGTWT